MNKKQINFTIILFLMIITGLSLYFMYFIPETFANPTTTKKTTITIKNPITTKSGVNVPSNISSTTIPYCIPMPTKTIPVSVLSRYFGVGFNVYPVSGDSNSPNKNQLYLIEHIPITTDGVAGGMYSLSSDGLLTIKTRNNLDSTQWWSITDLKDKVDNSTYGIINPFSNNNMALQYANGNLSINPYKSPGFESQRWVNSQSTITRGIPVLNNAPSSMFTSEFDPYSTSTSLRNLSDSNNKQVVDVVNSVKSGIQQFLLKMNPNSQVSSSSLGNKNMPLSVNLNLGSGSAGSAATTPTSTSISGKSAFANVTGSISETDMLSLLDKYDKNPNSNKSQNVYTNNDLQSQINQSNNGCKLFNINDYTSSSVSTCNCKL